MDRWIQWVEDYWKAIVSVASIAVFILLSILLFASFHLPDSEDNQAGERGEWEEWIEKEEEINSEREVENNNQEQEANQEVMVDIKGAVVTPGVYPLPSHARILDAVEAAGGLLEEADGTQINLAQIVTDQMMIYVPVMGEEIPQMASLDELETATETSEKTGTININTADAMELTQLHGIGEARSQSIIAYREENGPFETIEEIKNVSGIGESLFAGMKDEIVVKD